MHTYAFLGTYVLPTTYIADAVPAPLTSKPPWVCRWNVDGRDPDLIHIGFSLTFPPPFRVTTTGHLPHLFFTEDFDLRILVCVHTGWYGDPRHSPYT